ncbi:Cytochrome P450 [Rhynchospora pubera]|uniref:Cytochrome P450 n=1 Tax=Rhynchospora pubera TaxID=906938 RepID=A0AAV8FQW3_9POAL|nr:Cytochrome P450 [Rhynchospora pubera]
MTHLHLDLLFLLLSPLLIFLLFHFTTRHQHNTSSLNRKLPLVPPSLPLIGHLHRFGRLPHRSLQSLSSKHGPILLLHLGRIPTVILSSASVVQEAIHLHDLALSNRPHLISADILTYGSSSVPFTQYGEYWRQARRIYALHMLSAKQVDSFRQVRQEEVALLIERIRGDGSAGEKAVQFSKLLVDLTNSIACRVTFGHRQPLEGDSSIGKLVEEVSELLLIVRIGELIPWLSWIDQLRGIDKRAKVTADILDQFLERVIEQHLEKRMNSHEDEKMGAPNFINMLLDLKENDRELGMSLSMKNIKVFLWDMILAGTDTAFVTMEWAMAELIRHPEVMKQVQQEVRSTVWTRGELNEESVGEMKFLKAVISETLRLHPPAPILAPRETTQEIKLLGYHIPAKTRVIINAWAIGRDPESWGDRAEKFWPERFVDNPVDYKGQDFQFIPFGVGRRGCPGINFANRVVELALASLLYNFDWQLPDGMRGESLDMTETAGITVHLKNKLNLVAKPFV